MYLGVIHSYKNHMNKKAIVLVSVGTSVVSMLERTTNKMETKMAELFPDYKVCQAFSGPVPLGKMNEVNPGVYFDLPDTLDHLLEEGIEEVAVQPVYLTSGGEYEKIKGQVGEVREKFQKIKVSKPLFTTKTDYITVLNGILEKAALEEGEALLLVGHGSNDRPNTEYQNLEYTAYTQGHRNVFVTTLEGNPKNNILMRKLEISGAKKVRLMPLLLLAGKHAKKDIAGDGEGTWKTKLLEAGFEVEPILVGLSELDEVQNLFVEHLKNTMNAGAEEE